jgi:hypothetical protein
MASQIGNPTQPGAAPMRRILYAIALAASTATVAAHGDTIGMCDIDSDYGLQITRQALLFSRDEGVPARIEMARGELRIDGRTIAISDADRERLLRYEATVRELVPEAKALASEAVEIAFSAVQHVSNTFNSPGNVDKAAERLVLARRRIQAEIDASFEREAFNEREVEQLIEETIEGLLPALIGDITGEAIRIALTGDENAAAELEARAERMETAIERDVEARAERLEKRAEALCPTVADLDGIESSLELRLADNQPLDLVRLDRD